MALIGHQKRSGMIEVLVVMRPPVHKPTIPSDRSTEYQRLLGETQQARDQLINWLKNLSAWDEVDEVGEPNAFNIIPFVCSPRIASLLENAPGVEAVTPADAKIELLE